MTPLATKPTTLREEIRQTRPFPSVAQEAGVGLLRTADRLRRAITGVIEPHGITHQQYNVLRILRGSDPAPLPTLEIASRMIEETPGITRLLDRLEAKRLVRRERCRIDRRQVHCWITPAGLALLAELDGPIDRTLTEGFRAVGHEEADRLTSLLDLVRDGFRNLPDRSPKEI
jgi:DNA-binding MarR family transcriptional regulator